ncbi:hypothetical protein PV325_005422 [Microctonus aethiopoides]|nr:hypothetical protein PV325_005422 [Microctonus aethiopoides]
MEVKALIGKATAGTSETRKQEGKDLNDTSMQRLYKILIEVEMLSDEYNAFTNDFGEKQDERWKLIIDQRQKTEFLSFIRSQLRIFINIVDYMHKETINFEVERQSLDKKMATTYFSGRSEIEIAEKKFTKRVTDYYKKMYKAMISIPREIHRCEVNPLKRVRLFNAGTLGLNSKHKEIYCNYGCELIDHSVMEKKLEIQIHDCHTVGMVQDIQSCPAKFGSSRKYLWWKKFGNIYGHYETCPTAVQIGNGDIPYSQRCFLCECAVISKNNRLNENAILNISVVSQVSDIKHNMIVVGVKFVIHKNVLHLQIQQNKFVLNKINDNSSVWKSLDDHRSNLNVLEIQSERLSSFSGQLYLDDVMLPPKYAVTGVRFLTRQNHPEGFYLQIQGTPFDLKTGQLITEDATWFIAHPDISPNSDYDRDRFRINTENLDDPTRCTGYNYDRTINNYIRFYHSSVLKDGGQSTVPFIDAQSVETYPPFPLSGIGLFYRSKDGCGGGFSASSVSFIDIESIFLWKNSTYNDAVSYWLITKEFSNMSMRGLDQMMIEVDTLSEHYDEFTNDLRKKQDERWKLSVDRGRRIEFFSPVKFELSTLINKVDIMHKERINFRIERQYMNEMLRTRIPFLLETMQQLLRTLEQIHRLIFPSFSFITPQLLQLILVDAEV